MADTIRTDAAVLALLADNTSGQIDAREMRDAYVSLASRSAPSLKQFGAVGNGSADDSAKLDDAIDALNSAGGGTLFIPPGTYMAPDLTRKTPTAPISLVGIPGLTTIDAVQDNTAQGGGPLCWLELNASIRFYGIRFHRFTNVIGMGDGSGMVGVSTNHYEFEDLRDLDAMSGDIEGVDIEKCAFTSCRRAFLSATQTSGHILKKFRFLDNAVDDAWGGVHAIGFGYQNVQIGRNLFTNIDATAAGNKSAGGTVPIRDWHGRAVQLGRNRPGTDGDALRALNFNWRVFKNAMIDMNDDRTVESSSDPELHGIDCRSAHDVVTSQNYMSNFTVNALSQGDNEGIHFRDCVNFATVDDHFNNAGTNEGAIVCKGTQRQGRIVRPTIVNSDAYQGDGIVVTGSEVTIDSPIIVNTGRALATSYAIQMYGSVGSFDRDLVIINPTIIGHRGNIGIRLGNGAGTYKLSGGTIKGLTGSLSTNENANLIGVFLNDHAKDRVLIEGMTFKDFGEAPGTGVAVAIRWGAGQVRTLGINSCDGDATLDKGVWLDGGPNSSSFTTLIGNDFALASEPLDDDSGGTTLRTVANVGIADA